MKVVHFLGDNLFEIEFSCPDPGMPPWWSIRSPSNTWPRRQGKKRIATARSLQRWRSRPNLGKTSRRCENRCRPRRAEFPSKEPELLRPQAEFAVQDPARGNAKPADRRSSPEFDAQGQACGDEEELAAAERKQRIRCNKYPNKGRGRRRYSKEQIESRDALVESKIKEMDIRQKTFAIVSQRNGA